MCLDWPLQSLTESTLSADTSNKTTDLKRKPDTELDVAQKRRVKTETSGNLKIKAHNAQEAVDLDPSTASIKPVSVSRGPAAVSPPRRTQPIVKSNEAAQPIATLRGSAAAQPVTNTLLVDSKSGNTDSRPATHGCLVEVYYIVKNEQKRIIKKHASKPPVGVRCILDLDL